ncbi:hypothetical protein CSKR_203508, partial [Clonorchis sinensis]
MDKEQAAQTFTLKYFCDEVTKLLSEKKIIVTHCFTLEDYTPGDAIEFYIILPHPNVPLWVYPLLVANVLNPHRRSDFCRYNVRYRDQPKKE